VRHYRSKSLQEFVGQSFDYVITGCDRAKDSCPILPGAVTIRHWSFDDPAAAPWRAGSRASGGYGMELQIGCASLCWKRCESPLQPCSAIVAVFSLSLTLLHNLSDVVIGPTDKVKAKNLKPSVPRGKQLTR